LRAGCKLQVHRFVERSRCAAEPNNDSVTLFSHALHFGVRH